MKNFLLSIFLLFGVSAYSQTNLTIEISHKLNGENFSFLETGMNNLEQEFIVRRLEYYLSGFNVTHSNGIVTDFDDIYALISDAGTASINLGEFDGNNVEMISFSVGVDEPNNHADPAGWPSDHPLAPQFPAMHWGWAAGYRFIAIEGDENIDNQIFELHGLGDENYFAVELPVEVSADSDNVTIYINANTENILRDIDLSGGVIDHGSYGDAQVALTNMRDHVFEISSSTLSREEDVAELAFSLFPNPTNDGWVQLNFTPLTGETYRLYVTDIQGRVVFEKNQVNSGTQIELGTLNQGMYLFNLISDQNLSSTRKLIVK